MKALVLAPFADDALDRLKGLIATTYESWTESRRLYSPQELAERINKEDINILVVEADFLFEEVFEQTQPLRLVGICRNSLDHIDLEAATQHGVAVVHTPGRNARAVAEFTLGLMLSLARRIPRMDSYVKQGRWQDPVEPYICHRGIELQGRCLGILGLGRIGRQVARLGRSFGMRVLAYDPYVGTPGRIRHGALLCPLERVLRESDFLSLHLPSDVECVLNSERLAQMKPGAYMINTSAPGAVDQESLVRLLKSGHLACAALDIHESHPISPTSPFLKLDNVILTPHLGGATSETVHRQSWMLVQDIQRFLQGHRPRHLVNREVWSRHG